MVENCTSVKRPLDPNITNKSPLNKDNVVGLRKVSSLRDIWALDLYWSFIGSNPGGLTYPGDLISRWSHILPDDQVAGYSTDMLPDRDLCLYGQVGFAISGGSGCVEWTQTWWNILYQQSTFVLEESRKSPLNSFTWKYSRWHKGSDSNNFIIGLSCHLLVSFSGDFLKF